MDVSKIKTGIKRFFSNPNTLTFFLVIALIIVIYFVYSYMIGRAVAPVTVPYAVKDIKPLTEITSEDIGTVELSGNFVTANGSNLLQAQRNILHRYVAGGYSIPRNSFFYADAIADSSIADKTLLSVMPDYYSNFELPVDFHSTYGCSIMSGNYIDLYIKMRDPDQDNKIIYTWFITSLQVIKVFNSEGKDVFTENDEETMDPETLVFLVPDKYKSYLTIASHMSKYDVEIYPVPRNAGYTENPDNKHDINQNVIAIIEANTLNI